MAAVYEMTFNVVYSAKRIPCTACICVIVICYAINYMDRFLA